MIYYCDTEFTRFQGELLSLALVPEDETLPWFYAEVKHTSDVDPWVVANVMKHMEIPFEGRLPRNKLGRAIAAYFRERNDAAPQVVADWPEDLAFFMQALITGPGTMASIDNVTTRLARTPGWNSADHSKVPHHALYDAIAIRDYWNSK